METLSRKITRFLLIALLIVSALYLSYLFLNIILMLAVSLLLSLIFHPFVSALERRGIRRSISILLIIVAAGIILSSAFSYFVPRITDQFTQLSSSLSQTEIKKFLSDLDGSITRYVPFIRRGTVAARIEGFITTSLVNSIDSLVAYLSGLVSVIAILVIVPFMTFFILKDNKAIVKGVLNIVPNNYFEVSYWVIRKIAYQLGRFVRGWITDAFLVGLLSGLGLWLLGINNYILIGIVAGIGHLIPYFGPIIGGIPAIVISIMQFGDFSMLPKIIIMFLLVYTIDNGFIQPNVYAKSVDMHPLMIIVLMTIGSQVLGVFGLLLAVPLATIIKTAARELYFAYRSYSIISSKE